MGHSRPWDCVLMPRLGTGQGREEVGCPGQEDTASCCLFSVKLLSFKPRQQGQGFSPAV